MGYRDGTLERQWRTNGATHAAQPPPWGKYMQMWWNFSTTPHHARIIKNRESHQEIQGTDTSTKK